MKDRLSLKNDGFEMQGYSVENLIWKTLSYSIYTTISSNLSLSPNISPPESSSPDWSPLNLFCITPILFLKNFEDFI